MIQLNIGVPGSGKSYFVVKQIVDLAKEKKPKYKKIITNINGLKYDDLNKINSNVKFEVLHFDDLLDEIEKEYNFYIDNKRLDNYDDEVKKVGILSNFYDSLVVIDECHTLLTGSDFMKRFITYHRHWNIDLILITQAKSELDKVFLKNIEVMIVAQAPAKRFMSFGFRYFYYTSTSEYKTNLYQKQTVFLSQKYSKYYDSGSTKLSRSQILRILFPIIGLAVASFFIYDKVAFNHGQKDRKDKNITSNTSLPPRPTDTNISNVSNVSNSSLIVLTCFENQICNFKNNSFVFKRYSIAPMLQEYGCKSLFTQKSFGKLITVMQCQNPKINQIIGALNEKTDTNRTSSLTRPQLF